MVLKISNKFGKLITLCHHQSQGIVFTVPLKAYDHLIQGIMKNADSDGPYTNREGKMGTIGFV
jgi:hypothetical protein